MTEASAVFESFIPFALSFESVCLALATISTLLKGFFHSSCELSGEGSGSYYEYEIVCFLDEADE
ncbi:hypothetical protein SAMN05216412_10458 [Nitrosospira multiformis]|uniref:Uncharacterized protein n=1 Tax=Nitrosospira multiformis TaxID=1231 RepID=A0A1I0CRF4_9PROT|nr:hypothetical protein SAMN05216412_10458 [Nitrosospira multiformis]